MKNNILQTPEERTASSEEAMRKLRVILLWMIPVLTFLLGCRVQAWQDKTGSLNSVIFSIGQVLLMCSFATKSERLKIVTLVSAFAAVIASFCLPR